MVTSWYTLYRYVARLGELDLYDDNDGASPVTIPLAKATIHEEYSATTFTNDIAILTLEFPAENIRKFARKNAVNNLNEHLF